MSDIQTMKEMVTGLESKKKQLETDKDVFLRVAGINEQVEKANQDKTEYDDYLVGAKENRDDLKKQKADAVSKTTFKIAKKMNKVLPFGKAVFTYEEDEEGKRDLHIGWNVDKVVTPYNGLSGGQGKIFDAALANVLDANIIVLEAAELDNENLMAALDDLGTLEAQVLINTCHPIESVPDPFVKIDV